MRSEPVASVIGERGEVILTTDRLPLRLFQQSDLPILAALNSDHEVMEFLGGTAMSRVESDRDALGAQGCFREHGYGKVAVERISDGVFVGTCGLSREHWYPDDLEIGWRLGRTHWGNGYATEAAAAWLTYAFTRLAAPQVISIADAPNLRSRAVMSRIGLTLDHTAELPEDGGSFVAVIYSITADGWAHRAPGGAAPLIGPS